MRTSAKKEVIKRLGEIAAGVTKLNSEIDVLTLDAPGIRYIELGVPLLLSGDVYEKHHELISSLLKNEGWSDKFSECFLDKELRSIYAQYVVKPSQAVFSEGIDQIIRQYEELTIETIVLVPLAGIDMAVENLTIGQILFRRVNESSLAKILAGDMIDPTSEAAKKSAQMLLRGRVNSVLAEYRVVAIRGRAQERAFDECRRALDVLRYAQRVLSDMPDEIAFGIDYEPPSRERLFVYTSKADSKQYFNLSMQSVGRFELKITEKSSELLQQIGAIKVSSVLKKNASELSEFEEIVLRGLKWYSTAVKTSESENRFLNYTTCLETFFTPKSREPISHAIAEGCAFVLVDDVKGRKSLFKKIKELYGSRSGLSHGGKTAILKSEVQEMEFISWHLLFWMISKMDEFKKRQDLQEWIEEQRFK